MDIIKELRASGLLARIHIHGRKRVSLGEWKKRVPLLCSQDRVSKAETEAGHPFLHSFPVLKGPWGNAYLY